jgi:hypothetical protein
VPLSAFAHAARRCESSRSLAKWSLAAGLVLMVAGSLASTASASRAPTPHTPYPHVATRTRGQTNPYARPSAFLGFASNRGDANATDPFAHEASVNTVVPPFDTGFAFTEIHRGQLKVAAVLVRPAFVGEVVLGFCTACTGGGSVRPPVVRGRTWRFTVRGTVLFTAKTRFGVVVSRSGQIARFKVYGISLGARTQPVVLRQGCIAAYGLATSTSFFGLHQELNPHLPLVPCQATVPRGDRLSLSGVVELSPTQPTHETISGLASGSRWLTVWKKQGPCAENALSEVHDPEPNEGYWRLRASGQFAFVLNAEAATSGYFCAYLQTGGTDAAGLPDGRVTATLNLPFWAGDTLSISGPSAAGTNQLVTSTFAGTATVAEQLYVYDSYYPCVSTPESEMPLSIDHFDIAVAGAFVVRVNTFALARSEYRCAYLEPHDSRSLGVVPVLAGAWQVISVY